jgi:hypothetical protein
LAEHPARSGDRSQDLLGKAGERRDSRTAHRPMRRHHDGDIYPQIIDGEDGRGHMLLKQMK